MKLRDLQYLVAVYDHQSFSRAAEACFVSQPTLSGQIKKLEQELGIELIERSTRTVLFSAAGRKVVKQAREVLASVDQIKLTAAEFDDPLAGEFHLGVIPTVGPFLLPRIVTLLHDEFPQMHLFLHELKTKQLIERLDDGSLDAAILAKLDWQVAMQEWPLYREPFLLAMSESHELAAKKRALSHSVLEGEALLMLEDGHCLRDQALGVCFSEGAKEDQRFQATSLDTLLHMISFGHGMTLVPELACNANIPGVVYKKFSKPVPGRDIVMVARVHGSRNRGLDRLSAFIQKIMTG